MAITGAQPNAATSTPARGFSRHRYDTPGVRNIPAPGRRATAKRSAFRARIPVKDQSSEGIAWTTGKEAKVCSHD